MRFLKGSFNTGWGKDSNHILASETPYENNLSIQQAGAYGLTYHAKQLGKGLLVFGTGLLGYVGFSAFFGNRRETNALETKQMVDSTLAFSEENILNVQAKISGIPTSIEYQETNEFVPTAFLSERTILSIREKEVAKGALGLNYRSPEKYTKLRFSLSQQQRFIPDKYQVGAEFDKYQVGVEFKVNTYPIDRVGPLAMSSLTEGGFVVVWHGFFGQDSNAIEVHGQRYSTTGQGQPIGTEFQVNTFTTSTQSDPAVTFLTEGGFVVVWNSFTQDGDKFGVFSQRYNAMGQPEGSEFQVNTYVYSRQQYPKVTFLNNGGFVVVWQSAYQDGSSWGVYGQRYNATGKPAGSEFRINTFTPSGQLSPAVVAFPAGGFVVVWTSWAQNGHGWGIYGQCYSASGLPVGLEFQVNNSTLNQQLPAVAAFPTGGFVVVWQSDDHHGHDLGVYGQSYTSTGLPVGPEFQVYTDMLEYSITSLNEGGFVVVWTSNCQFAVGCNVYGKIYNAKGMPVGTEFRMNTYRSTSGRPSVTPLTEGGFVVVWTRYQDDHYSLYGRIFSATAYPTLLNNKLTIEEGETVIVTREILSAMDADSNDAALNFTVYNVQQGYFESTSNIGVEIISFIQQAITDGNIRFVHNGSTIKPYYEIKVGDGILETAFVPANVIFSLRNNPLTTFLITGSIVGGACLCLSASAILFILPGIFLVKHKQNNRRREIISNEQDIELRDTFDLIEEEGSLGREELTVTTRDQGFFQQPPIDNRVPLIDIPEGYRCPISYLIMCDPVITADGHTYERECIEKWFLSHNTSPTTNGELPNKNLIPNFNLKKCISEFLSKNKKFEKSGDVYRPSDKRKKEEEGSLGREELTVTTRDQGFFQQPPIDNRVPLIDIPEGYCCTISYLIMCNPVITADGYTYERECIEKWFLLHDTSPITNRELPNKNLIPNFNLKKCISEFLSKNKMLEKSDDVGARVSFIKEGCLSWSLMASSVS